MDITAILTMLLIAVFIVVGIALVLLLIEVYKTMKVARETLSETKEQLNPIMVNVKDMTTDIKPAIAKVDPLVDRVQLTVDALNLEMMRIDGILEDVSKLTDSAASATAAVDNITNAPIKAASNVATRVRTIFNPKSASDESAQLAEQKTSTEQALEDFRAAEEAEITERMADTAAAMASLDEVPEQITEPIPVIPDPLETAAAPAADAQAAPSDPDAFWDDVLSEQAPVEGQNN